MKAGESRAMTKLAWLHERGQGVRVNKRKALELYTEAAMRGEPEAQYRLAMYHLKGSEELENPDPQLARELLEKSVAGGCPEGMREIGQMYERGGLFNGQKIFIQCCEPDINKAYDHYKQAAFNGDNLGKNFLGSYYFKYQKDYAKAVSLF